MASNLAVVRGDYAICSGCNLSYPVSVLNLDNMCRDCINYDPRDHEDAPEDDSYPDDGIEPEED